MEATPRPWTFDPKSEEVWSPEGLVATVKQRGPLVESDGDYRLPETEANGEYIVRAVNAHDRLIEALEVFIGDYDAGMEFDAGELRTHYREMKAALALAREEVE